MKRQKQIQFVITGEEILKLLVRFAAAENPDIKQHILGSEVSLDNKGEDWILTVNGMIADDVNAKSPTT
jgi:hypothetical protein